MPGIDWNGNDRIDAGDWIMDYEIMNEIEQELEEEKSNPTYNPPKAKKTKRPLTEEELERNGRVLRYSFIVIGLMFSIGVLWNNIGWLFVNPTYVSWLGIIISIVILVLIGKNIRYHHKLKKEAKKNGKKQQ